MKASKLGAHVIRTYRNLRHGPLEEGELREHVFRTYLNVRYGMAKMAFALPLVLFGVGRIHGISIENFMSHCYFAPSGDLSQREFPMRV